MRSVAITAALASVALAAPAHGEVLARADNGFIVREVVEVPAGPLAAWQVLVHPAAWWDGQHTFSGDAAHLSLEPRAGGCFCEALPGSETVSGAGAGGVEHMRVVYAQPGEALRMSGALGPLQSEGLAGTMTITLKRIPTGTRITLHYVVGGFMRFKTAEIAPAVDAVLANQLARLGRKLGAAEPDKSPAPAAATSPAPTAPVPGEDAKAATAAFDQAMGGDPAQPAPTPKKPTSKKPPKQ